MSTLTLSSDTLQTADSKAMSCTRGASASAKRIVAAGSVWKSTVAGGKSTGNGLVTDSIFFLFHVNPGSPETVYTCG